MRVGHILPLTVRLNVGSYICGLPAQSFTIDHRKWFRSRRFRKKLFKYISRYLTKRAWQGLLNKVREWKKEYWDERFKIVDMYQEKAREELMREEDRRMFSAMGIG